MTIVKARLRLEGSKRCIEGVMLVDTGASVTIVDEEVADRIGIARVNLKLNTY